MQLKIKKLNANAKNSTYGTDFSAGSDFYNTEGNDRYKDKASLNRNGKTRLCN